MEASGALSVEEIERRRAAAATDEARVKVAAAQLAEAQARLSKTDIRSPQDGMVLTRTAEVGQTASPGARPCSASPATAKSRRAARSPSAISRPSPSISGARLLDGNRQTVRRHGAPARRRNRSPDASG